MYFIGDIINICVKNKQKDLISSVNNFATSDQYCLKKVKARIVGTSRKFPGFLKFSGYK